MNGPRGRAFAGRAPGAASSGVSDGLSSQPLEKLLLVSRKSGSLNLSSRGLSSIPPAVWNIAEFCPPGENWWELGDIRKLDLSHNSLSGSFSNDVSRLTEVQVVLLPQNKLSDLGLGLSNLTALVKIDCSNNVITHLPEDIGFARQLAAIHVSNNIITSLPSSIGDLSALTILDVSNNKLTSLTDAFRGMVNLTTVNASVNQLTTVPSSLGSLPRLTELNLSQNSITSLPRFVGAQSLVRLDIHQNRLTRLPEIDPRVPLAELYAGHNKLVSLPSEMQCAGICPSVKLLDLRDNQLNSLPDSLAELKLVSLDLQNNDLSNLPPSLGFVTTLNRLSLDGNPLRSIRREIWSSSTVSLLKYLRTRMAPDAAIPVPASAPSPALASSSSFSSASSSSASSSPFDSRPAPSVGRRTAQSMIPQSYDDDVDIMPSVAAASRAAASRPALSQAPVQAQNFARGRGGGQDMQKEIVPVQSLQVLDLSGRNLTALDEEMWQLASEADRVLLPKNKLTELQASSLVVCTRLKELDVSSNALREIPSCLGSLMKLERIILENNQIQRLPAALFAGLGSLRVLRLSGNRLESIPGPLPTSLVEISIARNRFGTFPAALLEEQFPHLQTLNISGCGLREVPPNLESLYPKLETLDISNNDIGQLPPDLSLMSGHLKILQIEGNPLRTLRQAIIQKGTFAILDYLKTRMAQ